MRTADRDLVAGYADMVMERMERGFEATLLTFMFRPLGGSPAARHAQMMRAVEIVYRLHVTFVHRHPHAVKPYLMPFWFGCSDWPVHKRFKDHLANIAINDGQHVHVNALTPPNSRLKTSLEGLLLDNQARYFPAGGPIDRIHATTVTETPEAVVDYVLKSAARQRCGWDEVLVLPRARSEMTRLTRAEWQAEREARSARSARGNNSLQAPGSS